MEDESLWGPKSQGAGVGAHFVVCGPEHVKTLVFVDELGHIKVSYFESKTGPLGRHQDVAGLEVAVDDPVLVEVHHPTEQLSEQSLGHSL